VTAVGAIARIRAADPPLLLAVLRIGVVAFATGYVLVRAPHLWSLTDLPAGRWEPVGVLGPLDAPLSDGLVAALLAATVLVGAAGAAGWRWRLTGPTFAVLLLVVLTYRHSWGTVLHTDHLVWLHVGLLALGPADERLAVRPSRPAPWFDAALVIRLMAVATVATYVVAGVAKLRNGGWDWFDGEALRNHLAYDNLRKRQLGDYWSPVGGWLTRWEIVFPPLSVASMAVELLAPVALWRWRPAVVWVVSAWSFHLAVLVFMVIVFPYQLCGLGLLPVLFDALVRRRSAGQGGQPFEADAARVERPEGRGGVELLEGG
jgi:hypothetical protein